MLPIAPRAHAHDRDHSRPAVSSRRRRRALLAIPAAAVAAALMGPPLAAATPIPTQPAGSAPNPAAPTGTAQGIIMRDGGVCDPIRHMGC